MNRDGVVAALQKILELSVALEEATGDLYPGATLLELVEVHKKAATLERAVTDLWEHL